MCNDWKYFATLMHNKQSHINIFLPLKSIIFFKLLILKYIIKRKAVGSVVASMSSLLVAALVCHISTYPNA